MVMMVQDATERKGDLRVEKVHESSRWHAEARSHHGADKGLSPLAEKLLLVGAGERGNGV